MSDTSLFQGTEKETIFKANLEIPPLKQGETIRDYDELREWLLKAIITIISQDSPMFSYTAGPASAATPDDRDKPRILFNDSGVFIGLCVWSPPVQNWSIQGVPGELKTIKRSANTVQEDMEQKFLNGWFVCDGTNASVPDLTTPAQVTDSNGDTHDPATPFFQGTGPDWDIYTVMKVT